MRSPSWKPLRTEEKLEVKGEGPMADGDDLWQMVHDGGLTSGPPHGCVGSRHFPEAGRGACPQGICLW